MNVHELEQLFIALLGPYNLSVSRKYTPRPSSGRAEALIRRALAKRAAAAEVLEK